MGDDSRDSPVCQFPTLEDLCARTVGTHPRECIYNQGVKLEDIPNRLQDDITQWISAYKLLDLDKDDLDTAQTEQLWQRHAEQRWLHKKPSQRNPFKLGYITWRQFYIDEHFKESLNYCANDYVKYIRRLGEDPKRTFRAPLVDVPKYRYTDPPPGYDCTNEKDLRNLVPHVRTLSISFRQLHYLELYPDILHALSHSVETLILQNLSTRGSLRPLRTLLMYGRKLRYLDVMNCIWDEVMMTMMTLMSGQMSGVEVAKLDKELSEESRKSEKDACRACSKCQTREVTFEPYQVPNFCVENTTIHPISDVKFVRILREWSDLEEFIHMCYPLSTPKVEQETIEPLMDALVYLARSRRLTRIHLNGPYHLSVFNIFTQVTVGQAIPVNDITYNSLIHCHMGCRLSPREGASINRRTRSPVKARAPGIVTLELNSVHCDSVLRPVIFKPIVEIVGTDICLRHLRLQSSRQFPDNLILLFRAITKAKRLVSLDITGNYIQRSAFGDLISMIKKCHSLRTLVVDYCELPTRQSYVQELAESVAKSQLTTISVARNRLGEHAAQMVVDILRTQNGHTSRLENLNVSQNCIKYEAVETMCDQLIKLRKELDQSGTLIKYLSLDDVLDCDTSDLANKLGQLTRLKVVGSVVSRNNLLEASRATMLGYVAQM